MTAPRKLLRLAPAILCASAAIYAASLAYSRRKSERWLEEEGLPGIGGALPVLFGYTSFGSPVKAGHLGTCSLIRYAEASCEACVRDAGEFAKAARLASQEGCTVLNVAPFSGASSALLRLSRTGSRPIVYLPYGWPAVVPLRSTPTTLLVDGEWRLAWIRSGSIEPAALSSLERALHKVSGRLTPRADTTARRLKSGSK